MCPVLCSYIILLGEKIFSNRQSAPTGPATSTNAAYGIMKQKAEKQVIPQYDIVDQGHPPVKPSPQFQSGEGEYEVPDLPDMGMQFSTVAPSQDMKRGTQEEAVYEPMPGDQ